MSHHYLMNHQTLIRDAEVFEFNYAPETINYRDQELRQLAIALTPTLRGASPINANLRGPPGTGKITCIRQIFSELEETAANVVTVFVNCEKVDTTFRVFAVIFEQLFDQQPYLSGIPIQRLMDPIAEELIKRKAILIVCLDDAHYLACNGQLDRIIYTLTRMYESYPGVKTGIVTTISNNTLRPVTVLEPSTYSTWQPIEIPFSPYQPEEVRTILSDRIRMGLYPGVITPAILDHIVTLTMEGGNLQIGIDILKYSVLNAEQDARTVVVEEDVTTAFETVRGAHLTHLIEALKPDQERLLSHIIWMKHEEQAASLTSRTIYESFKKTRDISYSTFRNWLQRLSDLRLINIHQRATIGNAHEIELRFDPGLMDE